MNRDQKAAVVEEIVGQIRESEAIYALDYRGISVTQAAELRAQLGEAGATFRVVKNTLTERAVDAAGADGLKELLEGPTAFTFVQGDAALAAKALAAFRRQNDVLQFKGGRLGDEVLTIDQIESLARLPALEVLHGQAVAMLASPLTGLVRALGSMISGLAVALGQVREQGLVSGAEEAPAETEEAPAEEAPAEEVPAAQEGGGAPEADAAEDEGRADEAEADADESSGDAPAEEPAADETEAPSEAPGDPVAEAEAEEEAQTEPENDTPGGGEAEGGGASRGEEKEG